MNKEEIIRKLEAPVDSSLWTNIGAIVEDEDSKQRYICGTNVGHLYPIIYEGKGYAVGIRKLVTEEAYRVRVQFFSPEVDDELHLKLADLGLEKKSWEEEIGCHYSRLFEGDFDSAVDTLNRAISILKGEHNAEDKD